MTALSRADLALSSKAPNFTKRSAKMTQVHISAQGRNLAFDHVTGQGPTTIFLGGFRSDMTGTKAAYLADWARQRNLDFLRFDYSGHGQSSGKFEDGSISDWAMDAADIATARAKPPFTLIGSSMGGWISLLLARRMPQQINRLITIAAAPDFTEDLMFAGFPTR
jgi:pimeloyl-ACP methyl ester carboxylesterase